ncbi:MAG: hypothetical protein KAU23_04850 [Anaerolineales bacterium]|nr:hypothetical protein [Anaerolineales bacterium]
MSRLIIILLLSLLVLLNGACGLVPSSASPPPPLQSSPTSSTIKVTPMSELPPTWTTAPTLVQTYTYTPSPTSPPPTATPDPNAYNIGSVMTPAAVDYPADTVDISGWNRIEGNTAAISIPPSYEVLDFADAFVEMMFSIIEAFAEGFSEFAQDLGEELGATPQVTEEISDLEVPPFDIIIAVEETSQSAIILLNVDRGPETTTEYLINQAFTDNEGEFQLVTRELLTNAPYPMERVILDVEDEELGPGKQAIYVILGDQNAWNVIFATPSGLFDQNLPLYEAAINSFTPLP